MNDMLKRFICFAFALAAAACSGGGQPPPLAGAKLGGPFALVDQEGRQVSEADFAGSYRIVYFGFAHCPDVCPTDLAVVGQAMRLLEKEAPAKAAKVQPIFITVDPERDTPPAMKDYVAAFHPRLVGLTGTPQQIADVAKKHAIFYSKEGERPDGGYSMNHSRLVMLFGPEGEPIALLPFEKGAAAVAAELERWVK